MATAGDDLMGLGVHAEVGDVFSTTKLVSLRPSRVTAGATATGSALADAYQIVNPVTYFTTVAASTGVKLSNLVPIGGVVMIKNRGVNALSVYPPTASGTINGGSAGAAISLATGTAGLNFRRISTTAWESE